MFKKIISYLIIFSILYANAAHCGSVWGRDIRAHSDDVENPRQISVRHSMNSPKRKTTEQTETSPLRPIFIQNAGDADISSLPPNFSFESFTETSQAQSLLLLPDKRENAENGLEEDTDEETESTYISSDASERSINANFKAIEEKRKGKSLSEWRRSSGTGGLNNSEDEAIPVDASLVLLEDDSAEESDTTTESTEPLNYNALWLQESAPSPRSSYESDSMRGMQLFFEDLLAEGTARIPLSLTSYTPSVNQDGSSQELTSAQELQDFVVISRDFSNVFDDEFSNLSPQSLAFLQYVKKRIVDGELNWKQKLGIAGGVLIGAGAAWPWMWIMFRHLLELRVDHLGVSGFKVIEPKILEAYFENFTKYVNAETLSAFVGIPIGLSITSNTASIFVELAKNEIQSFCALKNKNHQWTLLGAKSSAYFLSTFAGLLPVYYLYRTLLFPALSGHADDHNHKNYRYCIYPSPMKMPC